MEIVMADFTLLGSWTASAANEFDTNIDATICLSGVSISPVASGDIEELRGVYPADFAEPAFLLAPLLLNFVFPAFAA